mgnify:CR=1 FL=1
MGELTGKVALISGAAQGLGASHARAIVAAGGSVVIGDVNEEAGEALAVELGDAARFVRLDVTNAESWIEAVRFAEEAFGALNVLVNNAGILRTSPILKCDDDEWELVLAINLTGTFKGIRAAAPVMAKYAPASIINISSTAGLKGFAGTPAYNASKWGVRGLTKNAALELANLGIRVTSVHPGNVKTNMIEGLYEDGFPHVAQKRAAEPAEISNMVVFLASDLSSFATGSEFVVDGGETAGLPALW